MKPPKNFPHKVEKLSITDILSEQSHLKACLQQLQSHYYSKWRNISLHLARKYARIFVRERYLFRNANNFSRAKLEENCESRGTDYVQAKWRLLCLLSLKVSQHSC